MPEIKDHKRINDILLGPLERPALQWLAAHTPAWATPDTMTVVGIIGAGLIFVSYLLTNFNPAFLWLASLGYVINWYGDSLDGTLARYRHIERPKYGFFIDHTVDALVNVLIFTGLGSTPYIRFEIACLALIGYCLMSILVYVRTNVEGVFKLSYGKLGPTEVRVIAIAVNTMLYFYGNPAIDLWLFSITIADLICAVIAIVLFAIFVGSTVQTARELSHVD